MRKLPNAPKVRAGPGSTTRKQFIASINHKRRLFSHWLAQLKGERDYQRYVRSELKSQQALSASKQKHFLLDRNLATKSGSSGMVKLCCFLVDRFFKIGTALSDAVPPTVIIDGEDSLVNQVKNALLGQLVPINDGFEHLCFQPWYFDKPAVTSRTITRNGRPTDKIGSASFVLRLISRKTYESHLPQLSRPHVSIVTGPVLNGVEPGEGDTFHLHAVDSHESLISILQ